MSLRRDDRVALTLTFRILVAANRIAQPFALRHGRALGLQLPDWRCVMALAAEPGSSGEAVSRRMGMDKMAVSRALRRLERDGRVRAEPDPAHPRRRHWQLTEAGWAVIDTVLPDALERDAAAFGHVPAVDRASLFRLLDALIEGGADGAEEDEAH